MKLTASSDFAYRLLIYLATHSERLVTVKEVADAYGISHNHLAKISKLLIKHGLLEAQRGRGGGIRLGKEPEQIRLGEVVRICEPSPTLIDCQSGLTGPCVIFQGCALKGIFAEARAAFFEVLDRHTLHDIAASPRLAGTLKELFNKS